MVHVKNYETMSTFVKVLQKKTLASFFPDTVYTTLIDSSVMLQYRIIGLI